MDVQMKNDLFKPSDLISVLLSLDDFKTLCDSKSIHEAATMWLLPNSIQKPAKLRLVHRVKAGKKNREQEGKLTTYWQILNYLLEMYSTDDLTTEGEAHTTNFKKPAGMTAVRYSEALGEST